MSLDDFSRIPLLFGPSPVHRLERLSEHLGGEVEIWAKREDCNSGLAYGGNKVRWMAASIDLVRDGRIEGGSRVLYAHLGGQPALNGYAGAF